MTDTKKKIQNSGSGVNPVMAAVAGVVVGAGIAVAGAVVMSDKKNQAKVKEVANNLKDQFNDKKDDVKEKVIKEVEKI